MNTLNQKISMGLLSSLLVSAVGGQVASAADTAIGHVVSSQGGALIRSERPGGKPMRVAKSGEPVYVGDTINTASSGAVKLLLTDKTIIDIGASALFNVKKVEGGGPGRKIEVGLPYGTARAAVAKPVGPGGSFNMRSSAATMGVRGTEFVVQSPLVDPKQVSGNPNASSMAGAPKTTVTVLQGLVAVDTTASGSAAGRGPAGVAAGTVMVPAGTQLAAEIAPPTSNAGGAAGDGVRGPASQSGDGAGGGSASSQPVRVDSQTMSSLAATTRIGDSTFKNAITLDLSGDSGSGGSSGSGGGSSSQGESTSNSGGASTGGASASSGTGTEQSGSASVAEGSGAPADSGSSPVAASDTSSDAVTSSGTGTSSGGSAADSAGAGSGLANFTASLILDTVVAPPPAIAAVSAPAAVVQTVAQASFTGGASVENTVTAAQNVAPLTAGGTRRLTVIIER